MNRPIFALLLATLLPTLSGAADRRTELEEEARQALASGRNFREARCLKDDGEQCMKMRGQSFIDNGTEQVGIDQFSVIMTKQEWAAAAFCANYPSKLIAKTENGALALLYVQRRTALQRAKGELTEKTLQATHLALLPVAGLFDNPPMMMLSGKSSAAITELRGNVDRLQADVAALENILKEKGLFQGSAFGEPKVDVHDKTDFTVTMSGPAC